MRASRSRAAATGTGAAHRPPRPRARGRRLRSPAGRSRRRDRFAPLFARARSCRRRPGASRRRRAPRRRLDPRPVCARPRGTRRAPGRLPRASPTARGTPSSTPQPSPEDTGVIVTARRYPRADAIALGGASGWRARGCAPCRPPHSSPRAAGTGRTRSPARSRTSASARPFPSPTPIRSASSSTSAARMSPSSAWWSSPTQEPARVAAASPKCFYYQTDHWRGSITQENAATETYGYDGSYYFDKARGAGGVAVKNFRVAGQQGDPTTIPGFPAAYRPYFGKGRGGFQYAGAGIEVEPRCVELAKRKRVYRPSETKRACRLAGGRIGSGIGGDPAEGATGRRAVRARRSHVGEPVCRSILPGWRRDALRGLPRGQRAASGSGRQDRRSGVHVPRTGRG